MYFQISVSIAEKNAEFHQEIEFVDSMLDEAESTSVFQARHVARISRLDVNRIEAVMDIYVEEQTLRCVEMLKCEQCSTLAKLTEVNEAIREQGAFECSGCSREIEQSEVESTDVTSAYYFDPSSVSRIGSDGASEQPDNPGTGSSRPGREPTGDADLSEREASIVTELLLSCFTSPNDVVNFASNSSARPFRHELETNTLANCVRSLLEQSHRRELLSDVLLDLEKVAPNKRDRIVAIANHIEAKYDRASRHFRDEVARLTESASEPQFDLGRDSFLEEATSRNPFLDVSGLRDWIDNAERRICRIRGDEDDLGTGFLIADDLVLTCQHVVKHFLEEADREYLSVCFDKTRDTAELIVKVDPTWDIPFSKPSVGDELGTDEPPDPTELDFAILKLSTQVGGERGSFSLHDTRRLPLVGDPILIAGHPGPNAPLQRLKFSMAAPGYVGLNKNDTRMIYKTSTLKGSSGSPVFNRKFQLIGLHHNRGEEGETHYQNNRGIPISKIVDYLRQSHWKDVQRMEDLLEH
ncbi:trypsin-like serine peptidase [Neorhodopirellula lusitana]|uniref:trypsin-like serine peptidase n=1 Tax=Neorhodopirellula lusitana TaxID=445327 RepID=UPI00384F195F